MEKKSKVYFHGSRMPVEYIKNLKPGQKVVLAIGNGVAYGPGIYATLDFQSCYDGVVFKIYDTKNYFKRTFAFTSETSDYYKTSAGLEVRVISVHKTNVYTKPYIVVCRVEREINVFLKEDNYSRVLGRSQAKKQEFYLTPSKCKGPLAWVLGKILAIILYAYGLFKQSYKHIWLANFLLGLGGKHKIPDEIVLSGLKHLVKRDWLGRDGNVNTWSIRPDASKELFWMVGSMTIQVYEDQEGFVHVKGEDTYDFHPQWGQGVIAQQSHYKQWAYSENLSPSEAIVMNFLRRIKSLRKYFKNHNNKWCPSNDLWNALGGKPFISIIDIKVKKDELRTSGIVF